MPRPAVVPQTLVIMISSLRLFRRFGMSRGWPAPYPSPLLLQPALLLKVDGIISDRPDLLLAAERNFDANIMME